MLSVLSNNVLALLILLGAICHGIGAKGQPYSHEVHASQVDDANLKSDPGTVWITSVGFGANEIKAQRDAEKAAVGILIFQGLPGTQFTLPMVDNEAASRTEHAELYKALFDDEGYRTFVMKTASISGLTKMKKGGKKLETRILVDVNGLRRHLENNKVIRKFGL